MASVELAPLPKTSSVCTRLVIGLINGSDKESLVCRLSIAVQSSNCDSAIADLITRTKLCESIPVAIYVGCMDDVGLSCDLEFHVRWQCYCGWYLGEAGFSGDTNSVHKRFPTIREPRYTMLPVFDRRQTIIPAYESDMQSATD